jgi:hypothetical protein
MIEVLNMFQEVIYSSDRPIEVIDRLRGLTGSSPRAWEGYSVRVAGKEVSALSWVKTVQGLIQAGYMR